MDEKVAQFISITNASESTAAFYLESCGGDVEQAVQSFFDSGGAVEAAQPPAAPASGPPSLLAEAAAARAARTAGAGSSEAGPSSSRPARGSGAGGRSAAGNVRGLGDLGGGEEDEEDDDFNDYYVGGDKRWAGTRCWLGMPRACVVTGNGPPARKRERAGGTGCLPTSHPLLPPQRPSCAWRAQGQGSGRAEAGRRGRHI
jgi:hypothetical protein